MLRIFGVIVTEDFGFPVSSGGGDNYEQTVGPTVSALVGFRDDVRNAAKAAKPPLPELLAMCDKLRDEGMVELGVRVEDRAEVRACYISHARTFLSPTHSLSEPCPPLSNNRISTLV